MPLDRINFVNNGDRFEVGDREIMAIRPPFFDSPATRGRGPSTSVYFSVDSFGAVLPERATDVRDVDKDADQDGSLAGGGGGSGG